MKKILSIFVLLIASVALYAQSDVTKFLGIPVDGFKTDMIQKLKAKKVIANINNCEFTIFYGKRYNKFENQTVSSDLNFSIATTNCSTAISIEQ